jgi:hypothetical protein
LGLFVASEELQLNSLGGDNGGYSVLENQRLVSTVVQQNGVGVKGANSTLQPYTVNQIDGYPDFLFSGGV